MAHTTEHYVYVEDTGKCCLASYAASNRLAELDRRADRYLRAAHSRYARPFSGGAWRLRSMPGGARQVTARLPGARQSEGADALWQSPGRRHDLFYAAVRDKHLRLLGWRVEPCFRDVLFSRMVMLGKGWNISGLASAAGMPLADAPRKVAHRPLNKALIDCEGTEPGKPSRSGEVSASDQPG